tara:strand:+ start:309 stop:926 length:618 start_codon:yes stop_codon:yes gene_type:complete
MPIAYPYKFSDWYGYDKDCGGLPKFNSSLVSTAGSVCSATIITNKYWFDGSGSTPAVGDIVYDDASGGTNYLTAGYYKINTTGSGGQFIIVNSIGVITSVNACRPIYSVDLYFGNSPSNACWYTGSLTEYFTDNPTLSSGANTRVYTDAAGANPVTQSGAYVYQIYAPGSANEIVCIDSSGYVTSLAPSAGTCTSFPGFGSTCPL